MNYSSDLNKRYFRSNLFSLKKKYVKKMNKESIKNSLSSLEERLDNTLLRLIHFKPVYNNHFEGLISKENNPKLFSRVKLEINNRKISPQLKNVSDLIKSKRILRGKKVSKKKRLVKKSKIIIPRNYKKSFLSKKFGTKLTRAFILKRRS